ncbi:hypothetical protein TNCV_1383811 [Trichonephila clavipes]|nr:hypothetical protein TNCV_1383811 [Trichonephila clavipes]
MFLVPGESLQNRRSLKGGFPVLLCDQRFSDRQQKPLKCSTTGHTATGRLQQRCCNLSVAFGPRRIGQGGPAH